MHVACSDFVEIRMFAVYLDIYNPREGNMHVWLHLSSFEDRPEAGSSGSMMPVLTQRLSPLMFQHRQLSCTQQPTPEEFYPSGLTIPSHMERVTTCF